MPKIKWQCRIAPSLGGGFDGTPNKTWGTTDYKDDTKPTVFFGMYGLPDFYALWRHKGKRAILWAGSDITNFVNGYWLEDGGGIRLDKKPLAEWINKYCDNWVENEVEYEALESAGIEANVCPSFLGDIKKYKAEFKPSDKVKLYSSVSGNNFKLYGWDKIDKLAKKHKYIEFHLYGNTIPWETNNKNIIVHGRVPKSVMNKEIKKMTGAIRMTEFDGASEIIIKSMLWEQWPISLIFYPFAFSPDDLKILKTLKEPNTAGRDYFIKILNKYPFNTKK